MIGRRNEHSLSNKTGGHHLSPDQMPVMLFFMFQENFPLKQISHYKIGGKARYFFEAKNAEEIIKAIEKARQLGVPVFILAGASNVLIDDLGVNGLVIKPNIKSFEILGQKVRAGVGVSMNQLLNNLMAENLSGLEWSAGIPGTIGGAIYGNAGAFGKEMKDIIESVISLDISGKNPKVIRRENKECDFNYRSSIFKEQKGREIILEAVLKLAEGDIQKIKEEAEKNINYRFEKHPMEHPSLGSTFKNVSVERFKTEFIEKPEIKKVIKIDPFPMIPAAYLIAEAGLKGIFSDGAMISPKHPNFIVNVLEAGASDVKKLINLIKNEVNKKFGVELEEDIEYLS